MLWAFILVIFNNNFVQLKPNRKIKSTAQQRAVSDLIWQKNLKNTTFPFVVSLSNHERFSTSLRYVLRNSVSHQPNDKYHRSRAVKTPIHTTQNRHVVP